MLTTISAGSIVGPVGNSMSVATKFVRVERAFWHGGQSHAVGSVLEVPAPVCAELVSARKAVVIDKPAPVAAPVEEPPAAPMPTERPMRRRKE